MRRKLKQLIKSYFFEIILFFLLIIGLFLLIVDVDLKQNIGVLISFTDYLIKNLFNVVSNNISHGFKSVKLSNLLGFIILILGFSLILKRWKNRLLKINNSSKICMMCNSKINRVNKSNYFKYLGFFLRLKVRSYQCEKCNHKVNVFKKI